jgi:hypothetical protein
MPVVKFFESLDLDQICLFLDEHEVGKPDNNDGLYENNDQSFDNMGTIVQNSRFCQCSTLLNNPWVSFRLSE